MQEKNHSKVMLIFIFIIINNQGGVSVDMCKMDQIVNFNMEDFDVTVQPGVSRQTLNHYLKDYGLWFPVGTVN